MANKALPPFPGCKPGPTTIFEFEGQTMESESWLCSFQGPFIFAEDALLKPPSFIDIKPPPLNITSAPKESL